MKKGDIVDFFLFGEKIKGVIIHIDRQKKTMLLEVNGIKYPNVKTFKKLPTVKKEIPPWYILS